MSQSPSNPSAPTTPSSTGLWLGPLLAAVVAIALTASGSVAPAAVRTAAVTVLVATWWLTEAVPIGVASIVPVAAFPLLGVLSIQDVSRSYANPFIFLFLGGFMLAFAIERWGLHERLALGVMRAFGTRPTSLLLGMMLSAAFMSMWLSNTATTVMMLPIVVSLGDQASRLSGERDGSGLASALLLGLAYACNVGGMATPVGTPTNLLFQGALDELGAESPLLDFAGWTARILPMSLVLIGVLWLMLTRITHRLPATAPPGADRTVRDRIAELGRTTPEEVRVGAVFAVTALLLVTRRRLEVGSVTLLPGWGSALPHPEMLHDAVVAVAAAVVLCVLPSTRPGVRLLDWQVAPRLPWHMLLLLGCGFAIADAFKTSGLSGAIAGVLDGLTALPAPVLVLAVCLLTTFMTEITANTATIAVLLPILAALAEAAGMPPEQLMLPATLSASCAFMLPVATPPNTLVFGTGRVPIRTMVRTGWRLNLACASIVAVWCWVATR